VTCDLFFPAHSGTNNNNNININNNSFAYPHPFLHLASIDRIPTYALLKVHRLASSVVPSMPRSRFPQRHDVLDTTRERAEPHRPSQSVGAAVGVLCGGVAGVLCGVW
jgi:hypothetical protein